VYAVVISAPPPAIAKNIQSSYHEFMKKRLTIIPATKPGIAPTMM
jgi:hypothetical protein